MFLFRLFFFSYLGSLSQTFTVHRTAREGGGYFLKSSILLPTTSQTLRHEPGDYSRKLTSAHSQQLSSNWQPLVSERQSLTTKQRAFYVTSCQNAKLLKIFPFLVSTFYFHEKNKKNILAICSWYKLHRLQLVIISTNQVDQNI